MKDNTDKYLESFTDKVMKKSTLESPAHDFTAIVMSQVEKVNQSTSITYRPLISKRGWTMIVIGIISFALYVIYIVKPEASGWFNSFDFSTLNIVKLDSIFNGFRPSRIVIYGIGLLSLMLLIQIPLLKRSFDRRIEF